MASLFITSNTTPYHVPGFIHIPARFASSPGRWPHGSDGLHTKRSPSICVSSITTAVKPDPLKVMISGPPASGKGTQSELIVKKYGLVHVAAGDLLREEINAGTKSGRQAKEYMEKGKLVPDKIIVERVVGRVLQQDAQQNGWLFDGYPRSISQAQALKDLGVRPDMFVVLDVSEDILVERVVGRRLDPVTGKIYHLKYFPPETKEISARLIQRSDDTEETVKLRMQTYHHNVEDLLSAYKDVIVEVNGNLPKEDVFKEIDAALAGVVEKKAKQSAIAMIGSA